jgi:catechol 2,3-dioxygenase-like lactoylglutathione lyase family enzyme
MNLHHINIKAPALLMEAEKRFFCEVLGLHEGHRPDFASQGYWLYSGEQAIVHLSLSEQHFSNERQGYFDHVAFQTHELQELLQGLEIAGIEHSSNHVSELGMTQIFLKSPSATGIEVCASTREPDRELHCC